MEGLSYVSVCPIAKPLNKKRMNEMLKGCEGLGEGRKKAGVHSFKASIITICIWLALPQFQLVCGVFWG